MNNDLAPSTDTTGRTGFHSLSISIPPGDTGRPHSGAFSMTSCIIPAAKPSRPPRTTRMTAEAEPAVEIGDLHGRRQRIRQLSSSGARHALHPRRPHPPDAAPRGRPPLVFHPLVRRSLPLAAAAHRGLPLSAHDPALVFGGAPLVRRRVDDRARRGPHCGAPDRSLRDPGAPQVHAPAVLNEERRRSRSGGRRRSPAVVGTRIAGPAVLARRPFR